MWQQVVERQPADSPFRLLSVAVDAEPERVRPFVAGLSFPTVVDTTGILGRLFDFDVVPNGLFVDEQGVLRFKHIGGFDVQREEIAQQVQALIGADFDRAAPTLTRQESFEVETLRVELAQHPQEASLHFALGDALLREGRADEAEAAFRKAAELDPSDWAAPFALGTILHGRGENAAAVASWRLALANDPHNFTVRKQVWRVEHPEKFYPQIDMAWQQEQLRLEGYTPR